ncbi:MAG: FG-GAP repeat domain-containing protein, partial [Planctomycetota bacterium]
MHNTGSNENPQYERAEKILADNKPVDVYGMPSPNFADFDGDGDLDLICGEVVDKFTWFENIGTRKHPRYAAGRHLMWMGKPLQMDLCMIVPVALDWDKDGDVDLIVGQEDGRVALVENTGKVVDRSPEFLAPRFFQQQADDIKFGVLVTPYSFDWDNDGDEDLICGNSAGYVGFIENLDGANPTKWAAPVYLKANDKIIRIMAGPNGSIQGPCEAKWGYTALNVADWNHDGLPDII